MIDQKKNHSDIYQRVLQKRRLLRSLAANTDCYPSPGQIDEVILILGSSRSGSSLLYYLLSQHPDLISLQGEESVFTKLYGLNEINSFNDSDCLNILLEPDYNDLAQELLFDGGYHTNDEDKSRIALDRAQRLIMQWPLIHFDIEQLLDVCLEKNWENIIAKLAVFHPEMTLGRYDLFTNLKTESDPDYFIEEPPFIIPKLKSYSRTTKTTSKNILLLKSSINAFRGELLFKLFPKAEFKFIHLLRHPAASINGLMDGWQSNAFHTHHLRHLTKLNIEGYHNSHWWKFDLPPGWIDYTNKPLVEVCSFQWKASNEAILNFLKHRESGLIRYEEMLNFSDLISSLKKLCFNLQLSDVFLKSLSPPPPVMSVVQPAHDRWKEKSRLIQPILSSAEFSSLALKLGYKVLT